MPQGCVAPSKCAGRVGLDFPRTISSVVSVNRQDPANPGRNRRGIPNTLGWLFRGCHLTVSSCPTETLHRPAGRGRFRVPSPYCRGCTLSRSLAGERQVHLWPVCAKALQQNGHRLKQPPLSWLKRAGASLPSRRFLRLP